MTRTSRLRRKVIMTAIESRTHCARSAAPRVLHDSSTRMLARYRWQLMTVFLPDATQSRLQESGISSEGEPSSESSSESALRALYSRHAIPRASDDASGVWSISEENRYRLLP